MEMENVEAHRAETGECRESSDLRHEKTKKVFEERSSSTEVQITLMFLGPSISGCEVEKIAAGQPRRG